MWAFKYGRLLSDFLWRILVLLKMGNVSGDVKISIVRAVVNMADVVQPVVLMILLMNKEDER